MQRRPTSRQTTVLGMLEAIRTLSCRVCALGLEPRLLRSHAEIEDFDSPFLMQNIEVNDYLDGYAAPAGRRRRRTGRRAPPAGDARPVRRRGGQDPPQRDQPGHQRRADLPAGGADARASTACASCCSWSTSAARCRPRRTLDLETIASDAALASVRARRARTAPRPSALARELVEAHNNKYAVRDLVRRQYRPAGAQRHRKRQPHRRTLHRRYARASCAACSCPRPAPASSSASWR